MASSLSSAVPRATFLHHAAQMQLQRRLASSRTTPDTPPSLFKPPASVIKPWRALAGAHEWQTSAYHYNKQTLKTLPVAAQTTDRLLRDYATMIRAQTPKDPDGESGSSAARSSAILSRRRSASRMYISASAAKDFGDHVEVTAFVYDAAAAEKEEREREEAVRRERAKAMRASTRGVGAGRRRPVRVRGVASSVGRAPFSKGSASVAAMRADDSVISFKRVGIVDGAAGTTQD
ncbi:hypothetical protein M433DRAFT_152021, partial [Acidomyces richmondensis BFW]